MPESVRRESPLADRMRSFAATDGRASDVILSEHPFLGHVNLRGDPASTAFRDAAASALGCPLPREPNSFAAAEGVRTCWLGPDEWLVMCDGEKEKTLADGLRRALAAQVAAVTEVSSGQTVLALSGRRAIDVLAKGCPLDLHPRVFGPGRCAQTYIARAGALILRTGAAPGFELVVRSSFADYFWLWLTAAAADYSWGVVRPAPWKATPCGRLPD
jgi:sarcosine oxidase subunit gamma